MTNKILTGEDRKNINESVNGFELTPQNSDNYEDFMVTIDLTEQKCIIHHEN